MTANSQNILFETLTILKIAGRVHKDFDKEKYHLHQLYRYTGIEYRDSGGYHISTCVYYTIVYIKYHTTL